MNKCQECGKIISAGIKNFKGKCFCSIRCLDRYSAGVKSYRSEENYKEEKSYFHDYFKGRV